MCAIEDIGKTARFVVCESQITQNTEAATNRCYTEIAVL